MKSREQRKMLRPGPAQARRRRFSETLSARRISQTEKPAAETYNDFLKMSGK
jgi:hypothetical protein